MVISVTGPFQLPEALTQTGYNSARRFRGGFAVAPSQFKRRLSEDQMMWHTALLACRWAGSESCARNALLLPGNESRSYVVRPFAPAEKAPDFDNAHSFEREFHRCCWRGLLWQWCSGVICLTIISASPRPLPAVSVGQSAGHTYWYTGECARC